MAIGMTFDQYWYGDVRMTKAFVDSDRLRQERMNEEAWLTGMYHYNAISCAMKNIFRNKTEPAAEYPAQPYDISSSRKEKKEDVIDDGMTKEERELLIAKIMLDNERRASRQRQNWGG